MLGQRIAALERPPRRWIQRVWGVPEIDTRQKWTALWPELARLPERGVRLLDVGCGAGRWTLELASRRPDWQLSGVDRDADAIRLAENGREHLGLVNASFTVADFLEFRPAAPFDVILSVASAHYLVAERKGSDLFGRFRGWLRPGGHLLLLGPRSRGEAPFSPSLPRPPWHEVFSARELAELCRDSGLEVDGLSGRVGRLGTLAKQLSWVSNGYPRLVAAGLYALEWILALIDARLTFNGRSTVFWLLLARRPEVVSGVSLRPSEKHTLPSPGTDPPSR